jgi:hypothetical protein
MSFEYHEPLTFAFDLNVIPRSIIFIESRKSKPEGLFYIAYTITLLNESTIIRFSDPGADPWNAVKTGYEIQIWVRNIPLYLMN